GLTYPDIYRMQVRAIMDASQKAAAEGIDVQLGVMVPQVSHANEMRRLREILEESIDQSQRGLRRGSSTRSARWSKCREPR
ncbi:MAG: hypothetical protein QGI88_11420, partial [SAR202 cluster bacterium]|nr:hypothetical protein [SAR202 cluster bacterium]